MKIERIYASHFLGLAAVDVGTRQHVQLFAGANGAGKSSLRDAVALALTADLGRVSLKKEAPALIRDGADLAVVELKTVDGDEYRVSINRSGKITDSCSGRQTDPVLAYVLDAQRVAGLTPGERRAFLFELMGLKTEPAAVKERLTARGCDAARVERIAPLLRSGFDAAAKEAKAKATEAKGAWRAATGETYGSEKGKTWRAAVPAYDAAAAKRVDTELQHLDVAAEQWQRQVGALQAEETRRAALRAKLPALTEHAARVGRIETKLGTDEATLADVAQQLQGLQQQAGTAPRKGLVHDMARTFTDLLAVLPTPADSQAHAKQWDAALDVLDTYAAEHGPVYAEAGSNAEAAAKLPDLQRAHATATSAVANDKRDLAAAQQAQAEAAAIEAELAETFDAAGLAEARTKVDEFKAQRVTLVAKLEAFRSVKAAIDAADTKTKQAAQHHADVVAWDALADALGPDGIPGEMLAEALGPMNERMASSAVDTDWPTVVIDADMAITAGGRPYRLLSESERWRVDAVLAEAVAQLSGARLLVLDRFDVLDLTGRSQLLGWLDVLAETGEIDTALIFGTLKALPANLPETIGAHWIENGVVGQLKAAA
jgi:DNA repair exonuclease SbcCD ATPase subunit